MIFYEKRIWSRAEASLKIESYLEQLLKFRNEQILPETVQILQSIIQRMKETVKMSEKTETLRPNNYKSLAIKIWEHYKKDRCKKYDEKLFERQVQSYMQNAERTEDKHFVDRFKKSKLNFS